MIAESDEARSRTETVVAEHNGLYAVVLELLPKTPATVPAALGHQVHAAFLKMIREVDTALATELHAPGQRQRPFTVSPLLGGKRLPEGNLQLFPERPCSLRFTFLSTDIYRRLTEHLFRTQNVPTLRLGPAELLITEMIGTPGSSPWAGYTTWEELLEKTQTEEVITLEFASPTAFRQGDLDLPLPLPDLVFRSYLAKWRAFSPVPLNEALSENEFFARHIGVKEHRIRSVPFHDGRVTVPGFVGRVTFLAKGLPEKLVRQVNVLADFAFYAGTGRKTTHGMGMTRRVL